MKIFKIYTISDTACKIAYIVHKMSNWYKKSYIKIYHNDIGNHILKYVMKYENI